MKALILASLALLFVFGCASKKDKVESEDVLHKKFSEKLGTATKRELVKEFGNPEWCRSKEDGAETCRFYNKKGTQWMGDKKNRKSYEKFEQVVAEFDTKGILKSFEVQSQQ